MQAVCRKETIPVAFSRVCCGHEAYDVTVLFPLFVGIVTVANLVFEVAKSWFLKPTKGCHSGVRLL